LHYRVSLLNGETLSKIDLTQTRWLHLGCRFIVQSLHLFAYLRRIMQTYFHAKAGNKLISSMSGDAEY
jgi:hypothetical protein